VEQFRIQKVNNLNIQEISHLITESEEEGFRHIKRLVDEYTNNRNRFEKQAEALFLAVYHDKVVGICGLNQEYLLSDRVGRVRRLYVSKDFRRLGIARILMKAVIEVARKHFDVVVLKTDNPVADKFYRSLGFNQSEYDNTTHFLRLTQE
jgi:GNAT superfamily N-acetyltransferase